MMYQSSLQTDSRLTSVNQTVSNRILYSESSSSSQSLIEETQQSLETSSLEHQRSQTLEHQYFDPNQVLNREPTNKIISNHFTILSADHRKQNKVESKEELRETANFDPLTKSTYKKILESNERSSDSLIKKQSHNSKNQLTAINHTKSQFNSDTNFITKSFFLEIQVHLHDSTELIRFHSHLGVGKTSILEKVKQNKFSEEHYTTIGVDFNSLVVEIFSDTKVKLQVWDTVTQLSLNKC